MKYFIKETNNNDLVAKTAGVKARADAEEIFVRCGCLPIEIPSIIENRKSMKALDKIKIHLSLKSLWSDRLSQLKSGDIVYIQFPLVEHTIFFYQVVKKLEKKGIHFCILIHDVEAIRAALRTDIPFKTKLRLKYEENSVFKECSTIIAHNENMKQLLIEQLGVSANKIRVLEIFDYLLKDFDEKRMTMRNLSVEGPVIIAGALVRHKVGYVYQLPEDVPFNLYGIGYEEQNQDNIHYLGAFDPNELPYVLEGSFGLIWDGDSSKDCVGVYGEYLKVNNPHKTSLYLASGIPIVIWKKAALASFIEKNHCGIAIDSLYDLKETLNKLTKEDYEELVQNTKLVSKKIRDGYYLSQHI